MRLVSICVYKYTDRFALSLILLHLLQLWSIDCARESRPAHTHPMFSSNQGYLLWLLSHLMAGGGVTDCFQTVAYVRLPDSSIDLICLTFRRERVYQFILTVKLSLRQ